MINRPVFYYGLNDNEEEYQRSDHEENVAIAAVAAKNKTSWANIAKLPNEFKSNQTESISASGGGAASVTVVKAKGSALSTGTTSIDDDSIVVDEKASKPICKFFLKSICEKGESCPFSHNTDTVQSDGNSGLSCGICLETPSVFGINNGCDHVFCFACIKSWREKGSIQSNDTVKTCPVCRKVMHLIVPSAIHPSSPSEKAKIIEEYKKKKSKIQCKNIGNCKFGSNCMFSHSVENGGVMPNMQTVRMVKNADGKTITLS